MILPFSRNYLSKRVRKSIDDTATDNFLRRGSKSDVEFTISMKTIGEEAERNAARLRFDKNGLNNEIKKERKGRDNPTALFSNYRLV